MSTQIHPTAIVDSGVDLGVETKIGPYAVIEAGCVIGDYCEVRAHAVILKGIGSGNKIREYATIHRASVEGTATLIGNDNFLMGGVHVGHDAAIGDRVIMANNTLLSGYVKVEDGAFLGGATIVHQHTRIGRLAITRGGTRLGKDVPPFFMATDTNQVSGINRIGLRRAGFSQETRRAIQAAFEMLYRSDLNVTQALEELRRKFHAPEIEHLTEFIRASKRGICRADRGPKVEEEE
jgi:UDP-N-acetylglucosamine acyltransferase